MSSNVRHGCDILLPDIYNHFGTESPQRVFARIIHDSDDIHVEEITWGRLMLDARQIASYLLAHSQPLSISAGSSSRIIVGFLASSRYIFYAYEVAVILLGWTPQLLSDKNRLADIRHLLRLSNPSILLVDTEHLKLGQELCGSIPSLNIVMVSATAWSLYQPFVRHSISVDRLDEEKRKPALFMHTSGSTESPKLVPVSHQDILAQIRTGLGVGSLYDGESLYGPLSLSHGIGYCTFILYPLGSGVIPTFVHSKYPLNAQAVLRHIAKISPGFVLLPPSLLEDIVVLGDHGMKAMRACKRVAYAGGPLRQYCGDILVQNGVPLMTGFGMTEVPTFVKMDLASSNPCDWQYLRFLDNYNLVFRQVDGISDMKELLICCGSDGPPLVINSDEPVGFATKDLWCPHPTQPGLWRHSGRTDSMIVLSNGLKVNCKSIENTLLGDVKIASVITFGIGQFNIGVIIEPASPADAFPLFLEEIWPTIVHLNDIVPHHARLLREMIIIQSTSKPFMRSDKRSIKSKETLDLYSEEIKHAYESLAGKHLSQSPGALVISRRAISTAIVPLIQTIIGQKPLPLDNLFEYGLDSLRVIQLRSALNGLARQARANVDPIPLSVLYSAPTVNQLASVLEYHILGRDIEPNLQERCRYMEALINKYSNNLNHAAPVTVLRERQNGFRFLISGSTGGLGCHIITSLLLNFDVAKIYCLCRPHGVQSSQQRLEQALITFGISPGILISNKHKLELIEVDFSRDDAGMSSAKLDMIRAEVTHFVHTAWNMNFNSPLEDFESMHINGLRILLRLALSSSLPSLPHFVFISSISVGDGSGGSILEEPISDTKALASKNGYTQAKYVCERIIDRVACSTLLRCGMVRCGQLSGSSLNGRWNPREHIPILLRSSAEMGILPYDFQSHIRWLPVNVAAEAVIAICLSSSNSEQELVGAPSYWHVDNAVSDLWSDVVNHAVMHIGEDIKLVSYEEWLNTLDNMTVMLDRTENSPPASALLDFYRGIQSSEREKTVLDIKKTITVCPLLNFGSIVPLLDLYIQSCIRTK